MKEIESITKNTDQKIEDDMTYGVWSAEGHWHYPVRFDLKKVEDPKVRQLITEEIQLPRSELERRFRSLAKRTSMEPLQTNNLALVDHFLNGNNADKLPFPDATGTLTQKVFEHKTTKQFIEGIKKTLGEELRDAGSVPESLDLSNRLGNVPAPQFSGLDNVIGLAFAIHILYGYSVAARDIICDWEAGRYKATVDIEMTDHFGMDYGDVDEFGTTEKVWNKIQEMGDNLVKCGLAIGLALGAGSIPLFAKAKESKSDVYRGFAIGSAVISGLLFGAGIAYKPAGSPVAKLVSEGFRAWFILQHYHGCRPFLTVMRKTIAIEDVIPKR